ncbi:MAG: type II secretion system protein [Phycisphaeraceae bacterium]|nr:type II secretion system protein [Phycisphaeraceae bacterium]
MTVKSGDRLHSGFTLIELLVVISVIAMLLAILLPSLAAARNEAYKTVELTAARQLNLAVTMYADANNQYYIRARQTGLTSGSYINVDGQPITDLNAEEARRYTCRLAAYVGHHFKGILYVNDGVKNMEDIYRASLIPSFGLNSEFVAGLERSSVDTDHLPDWTGQTSHRPTVDAATPSGLIDLVSARYYNSVGALEYPGYYAVFAPRNANIGGNVDWLTQDFDRFGYAAKNWGQVDPRYRGAAVVGYCDGHANAMKLDALRDMRLWSDQARRANDPDYDPIP